MFWQFVASIGVGAVVTVIFWWIMERAPEEVLDAHYSWEEIGF